MFANFKQECRNYLQLMKNENMESEKIVDTHNVLFYVFDSMGATMV